MITETQEYDIVIAGGGMTGAVLAIALSRLNPSGRKYRIALVEAKQPQQKLHPGFDGRAIALSARTVSALKQFDIWPALSAAAHAIHHIHVSEKGHAGRVTIDATEFALPALGYVLELSDAGYQLYQMLQQIPEISHYCPVKLDSFEQQPDFVSLSLSSGEQLSTRLLVSAEGAQAVIPQQLHLPVQQHDFSQSAIITTLNVDQLVNARAWERFTAEGPLALLPLGENSYSVVWCQQPAEAVEAMQLSDAVFTSQLQQAFGYRAGRFLNIGERAVYPLSLRYLPQMTHHRITLLGNAAHQLHPVAGQGFNLAMRDIISLQEVLAEAVDPGGYSELQRYRQYRDDDQQRTIWMTSSLATLFTEPAASLVIPRQLGLMLMNRVSCLKNGLVQQALGHR